MSEQPVPGTGSACAKRGAGRSAVPYLALHPMGFSVPPRLRLERWALTPPFHPCQCFLRNSGGLSFCGTVRRQASRPGRLRVSPTSRGYAASRPAVFGLSSPGSRRKRSSALPKSSPIYEFEAQKQPKPAQLLGPLGLGFEVSLELGCWCLELSPQSATAKSMSRV